MTVKGKSLQLQTGITNFTRTNNIFDLAGNCREWTQEARGNYRCLRGGYYADVSTNGVTESYGEWPEKTDKAYVTTRPTMYVTVPSNT